MCSDFFCVTTCTHVHLQLFNTKYAVIAPHSDVTLNGKLLQLDGDSLPDLVAQKEVASDLIHLPGLSFGFYVFKDTVAGACT